ncbi:MAG TPA: hypothetical protein PL033_07185 [Candidatus Brocadiia bacterium]|nr:hypothetical protein [Candidatus Brocadiia bacterium]
MPIRFKCKECGERLEMPSSHFGRRAFCTECGKSILVPLPVAHACDKCGKSRVMDGRRDGQICQCGGQMKATQMFIKKLPGEMSRTYDVDELMKEIGSETGDL